ATARGRAWRRPHSSSLTSVGQRYGCFTYSQFNPMGHNMPWADTLRFDLATNFWVRKKMTPPSKEALRQDRLTPTLALVAVVLLATWMGALNGGYFSGQSALVSVILTPPT